MKFEKERYINREPILKVSTPMVLEARFLDDYGDHLNQGKTFTLFEENRAKIWEDRGFPLKKIKEEFGILAFVREQQARYPKQVKLNEEFEMQTKLYMEKVQVIFNHQIITSNGLAVDGWVDLAIVNTEGRPTRIPDQMLAKLSQPFSPQIPHKS